MSSNIGRTAWRWSLLVACGSWSCACASDVVVGGHDPTADDASETQQNSQDDARDTEAAAPSDDGSDDRHDGENKPFPPDDFDGPFPERDRPPLDDGFGEGPSFDEFGDAGPRLPDVDPTHGDDTFADDTFADDTFADDTFADDTFADDTFADRDEDSEASERDGFMEPGGTPGTGAASGDAASAPGESIADAGSASDAQADSSSEQPVQPAAR